MYIKIHPAYRTIVALCDRDLLGKIFEEGIKQINVKEQFYKGEEKDRKDVIKILMDMQKEDATFNIVGKESVECALEARIVDKSGVTHIEGVPVALVLL